MSRNHHEEEESRPGSDAGPSPPGRGEVVVPRWVILVTFVIGWGAGGAMLAAEIFGQGRFQVMLLAAWLITLPLVASNPFRALREVASGTIDALAKRSSDSNRNGGP